MSTTTECPVEISSAAADYVQKIGAGRELTAMIEHTRSTVEGLRSISVSLDERFDVGAPILILAGIEAGRPHTAPDGESLEWKWEGWAARTFPGEILEHFCMMTVPAMRDEDDGR